MHSGHGGGVEADHFDHAVNGARHAFRYLAAGSAPVAMRALVEGFCLFDADHARFFAIGVAQDASS